MGDWTVQLRYRKTKHVQGIACDFGEVGPCYYIVEEHQDVTEEPEFKVPEFTIEVKYWSSLRNVDKSGWMFTLSYEHPVRGLESETWHGYASQFAAEEAARDHADNIARNLKPPTVFKYTPELGG